MTQDYAIAHAGLPPLPEGSHAMDFSGYAVVYTESEMRDYAHDALASLAAVKADAARFAYLTADLSGESRVRRNALLDRMKVMSYSAVCTEIDAALACACEAVEVPK